MKSYGHLYEQICSFENLLLAARNAQRGKRFRENVGRFNLGLEREIFALQEELRGQAYRPGGYRELKIFRPKERLISAAPYRDRVVHHALCNVIEPIFDRTFIEDTYVCRKGKGTHRAVDRLTAFCRRSRYALQCDIRKYFPSIDHEILLGMISRKIRDKQQDREDCSSRSFWGRYPPSPPQRRSLRGVLKGCSISAEEIDQARQEIWGTFPSRWL